MELTFTHFVRALRNAEIRVSPAETLDAFSVLEVVGIEKRSLLKDSLSLALAKTSTEKEHFDKTFDLFFDQLQLHNAIQQDRRGAIDRRIVKERLEGRVSSDLVEAVEHAMDDDRDLLALQLQRVATRIGISEIRTLREKNVYARLISEAFQLDHLADRENTDSVERFLRYLTQYIRREIGEYVTRQYRIHVDPTSRQALLDAAIRGNLNHVSPEYHHAMRSIVEKLAERLVQQKRRKRRRANRGDLNVKRTMRANMAFDGTIYDLHWRKTKREVDSIFVICDVSNSVAQVARFLLYFLYELTDVLPNVRAFAFSSQLGEITEVFRKRASEEAIEATLFKWGKGNTDYGRAFVDFRSLCGSDIGRRSTVIVVGDGRSNYYDPAIAVLKQISTRAKHVFWLNPEPAETWREGDSEMRRFAPLCTRVDLCNRLTHIERFADRLLTLLS